MSRYTITIHNKTGTSQNYQFFNDRPDVQIMNWDKLPAVWSNVLQTAEDTSDGEVAQFHVQRSCYGVAAHVQGTGHGAQVLLQKAMPAVLNGEGVKGRRMWVWYDAEGKVQGKDEEHDTWDGCFAIMTDHGTKDEKIAEKNLVLGIGRSADGYNTTPAATFIPESAWTYRVRPSNVYYVSSGKTLRVGQRLDMSMVDSKIGIDFGQREGNKVTIVHTMQRKYEIQK